MNPLAIEITRFAGDIGALRRKVVGLSRWAIIRHCRASGPERMAMTSPVVGMPE